MFGYVLPQLDTLPEEERLRFQSVYCGLCHTLAQRHGLAARFILNYDFAFLAMLLSEPEESEKKSRRCIAHPVHKREVLKATDALNLAADESVILAYWQLKDGVADHGFAKGLKYRITAEILEPAYRRAAAARPAFDRATRQQLNLLAELEREKCSSIDRPADAFAQLLAAAAEEVPEKNRQRILRELLYHLGRWIYLVDAADDLKKDAESGCYNPLLHRFSCESGVLCEEDKRRLALTMDHSVHLMEAAYELWDFGCWSEILQTTLYRGLFQVGRAVLDGQWNTRKSERKNKVGEDAT